MNSHITKGSVFDDMGFSESEAAHLKIRAALMRAIEDEIVRRKLTQAEAAKLIGVTQPRISDLKRGKMHLFTVDMLISMLAALGKPVHIIIDDRIAA